MKTFIHNSNDVRNNIEKTHVKNPFSNWSELTSSERNEIVFEGLNKNYGAYEIRSTYDKSLIYSFLSISFFTALLFSIYYFSQTTILQKLKIPNTDATIFEYPKPIIEQPIIPIQPKQLKTSPSTSTKDLIPKVVDKTEIEKIVSKNTNNNGVKAGNSSDTSNTNAPSNIESKGKIIEDPIDTSLHDMTIDELPRFPGSDRSLSEFIRKNLNFKEEKFSGKIGVQFVVNKDGSLTDVKIYRGSEYSSLNNEAIRVINKMPNWEPGKINGHPVRTRVILPIKIDVK